MKLWRKSAEDRREKLGKRVRARVVECFEQALKPSGGFTKSSRYFQGLSRRAFWGPLAPSFHQAGVRKVTKLVLNRWVSVPYVGTRRAVWWALTLRLQIVSNAISQERYIANHHTIINRAWRT